MSTNSADPERLVKSRQRVSDHGEVFTPAWLVNDMLDLVKHETERVDSRFLEPGFVRKSGVSRDTVLGRLLPLLGARNPTR